MAVLVQLRFEIGDRPIKPLVELDVGSTSIGSSDHVVTDSNHGTSMTGGAVHSINTGHASHKPISSALRWAAAIRLKSPIFRDLRGGATVRPDSQLIRCVLSRLSGVAVYLRRDSPSFWKWICVENDAARGNALHVAKDCAQGFLALIDDTLADYHMSAVCVAELARGARRNDPTLAIAWPFAPPRISERVSSYLDHCT